MKKLPFLQKEPLSRLGVAFLLMIGVVTPLLIALELSANVVTALVLGTAILLALTMLNATPKTRPFLWVAVGLAVAIQFVLPSFGFFGAAFEAVKALALYFSGVTVALPLYGSQVALLLAVLTSALGYVFSKRGVGFLPAALIVVLVLFGLWSLGKGNLFWYTAPALVALLLLMAQAAHEKINVLHVLPMAVAVVLLAFLILPSSSLTVEPLAQAASDLKQAISDYLFFTEPRNVFSLGSYGYYPMGNNQLGGEAEPSEYPVMMVKTSRKTLLRAVAKDEYTGRSFRDTSSAKRYLYVNPRWLEKRKSVFLEDYPSEAIRKASMLMNEQTVAVQMQNTSASTVFAPAFPRSLEMQSDMVAYFNDSSELFITRDLTRDDQYAVNAPIFEGGDAGLDALVNACLKNDKQYASIFAQYTQLPDHMEQKVFNDVADIVANAGTPYDKAMAIMRHLQKYYRYTLSPDTPPDNQDFVTYFLYVGKEGYCTYYASAMTVMCRMAGLPARYVEGFVASPAADGFAYVTGKEAHAWTEVYFEGFGWVPFDPTPAQNAQSDAPQNQSGTEPSPSPSPSPSPEPNEDQPTPTPDPNQPDDEPTPEANPSDSPEPSLPNEADDEQPDNPFEFPWWTLFLLAALAGLAARMALRVPDRVAMKKTSEQDKIFVYGAAVQHLLQYAKRTPKNGETPLAFAKRLDSVHAFSAPITPLWRILTLSNYSRMEPGREQTMRAKETYHRMFKSSHLLRRIRFMFAAAFVPRFYDALDTHLPHDEPPKTTALSFGSKGSKNDKAKRGKGKSARGIAKDGNERKPKASATNKAPKRKNGSRQANASGQSSEEAPRQHAPSANVDNSMPREAPQAEAAEREQAHAIDAGTAGVAPPSAQTDAEPTTAEGTRRRAARRGGHGE